MNTSITAVAPSSRSRMAAQPHPAHMQGFSLVEVMVALTIGLILTLGMVGLMGGNAQNLRLTESLSESQENARMAFELIARDVRQARDTSCGPLDSSSVRKLDPADANPDWWEEWWPLRGFAGDEDSNAADFGTARGERVDGTEALQLQETEAIALISKFNSATSVLLTSNSPSFTANEAVIVCDLDNASLHTIAAVAGSTLTLAPAVSITDPDNPQFQVARYLATTWYIGSNGRADEGGRSLYRARLAPDGTIVREEILPGIVDMQVRYHNRSDAIDNFMDVDDARLNDPGNLTRTKNNWDQINAIELTLVSESTQKNVATSDAAANNDKGLVSQQDRRLRRTLTHIIALRNTH
ncbi:MAG: PilW family protein [Sterolibacterium sp.]|nr:PilW family protein [Sterolibacterium sp.]